MRVLVIMMLFFYCAGYAQTSEKSEIEIAVIEDESRQETDSSVDKEESSLFFQGSYDDAKAKAKEEEKDVLLHFGADWCFPCKQMKKLTYPNTLVKKKMDEGYIPFEVDVDFFWGMDIAEEFGVLKYPTVIIINSEGEVRKKHEGSMDYREMYKFIRKY